VSCPGAEAPDVLKGAKVRKLPMSGAATRDHFPKGPMQKAMISLPSAWTLGMRDSIRTLSSGCRAMVTSLTMSMSAASIFSSTASSRGASGVPAKLCQDRMSLVFSRFAASSRRKIASVANSTSRQVTLSARASERSLSRSDSLSCQLPPSAARRLVAITGPGKVRKSFGKFGAGSFR